MTKKRCDWRLFFLPKMDKMFLPNTWPQLRPPARPEKEVFLGWPNPHPHSEHYFNLHCLSDEYFLNFMAVESGIMDNGNFCYVDFKSFIKSCYIVYVKISY